MAHNGRPTRGEKNTDQIDDEEFVEENINEQIAVFDIESENWIKFRVLGFYDGSGYKNFFSVNDFLNYVNDECYRGWKIFAHNGGRFDFLFLLEEMLQRRWQLRFIERGGSVIGIIVKTSKTQFTFCDSYALLKASLKKLGIAFDTPHKKKEYTFKEGARVNPHEKKLLAYLKNDCLCLYECLMAFQRIPNIGKLQMTVASQAMYSFRKFFCDCIPMRIKLPEEELIRERFYSGGSVEVFKGHGKNLNYYDVNSLFPTVMMGLMPCGKMRKVKRYVPGKLGFYEVQIDSTPEWYVSPLLYKIGTGHTKESYYVKGPGRYNMSSAMIEYLKKEFNVKCRVRWGYVFSDKQYLFREYVNYWYKIKQNSPKDSAQYMLAKLMLNSLYGKFAQARWRESLELISLEDRLRQNVRWTDWEGDFRYGLCIVLRESHSKFILPYVAAWITDQARLYHYKLMAQHPKELYYCDTDSIITSADYSKFVGPKLGQLSYLGRFEGIFLSPKTYALRRRDGKRWIEKIVFKGFDADKFTFDNFRDTLLKHKQLEMSTHRILGFRECFSRVPEEKLRKPRKEPDQVEGRFLKRVYVEKRASAEYDKRMLIPDKEHVFETRPFTAKEAQEATKTKHSKQRKEKNHEKR